MTAANQCTDLLIEPYRPGGGRSLTQFSLLEFACLATLQRRLDSYNLAETAHFDIHATESGSGCAACARSPASPTVRSAARQPSSEKPKNKRSS